MQITIDNISDQIRDRLEASAQRNGKSLSDTVLEALDRGLPQLSERKDHTDLDWFIGSGSLEPEVIQAIREHDVVHPDDMP